MVPSLIFALVTVSSKRVRTPVLLRLAAPLRATPTALLYPLPTKDCRWPAWCQASSRSNKPLISTQGINGACTGQKVFHVVLLAADASQAVLVPFHFSTCPSVAPIWLRSSERIVPFFDVCTGHGIIQKGQDSRIAQAGGPAKSYTNSFVISVADKKIAAGQRGVKLQAVQNTPLISTQGINGACTGQKVFHGGTACADASRRCSFRSISVPARQ